MHGGLELLRMQLWPPAAVQAEAMRYLQALGPAMVEATNTTACHSDWRTLWLDWTTPPVITRL